MVQSTSIFCVPFIHWAQRRNCHDRASHLVRRQTRNLNYSVVDVEVGE